MITAVKQETIIQQYGVIEIRSPEFRQGMSAEIIILLKNAGHTEPNRLRNLIGTGRGGFETPEEADSFIRKERDRW